MILRVTTAAWQQNMCTGAYLPMWEGEDPAYKIPTYYIASTLLKERTAVQIHANIWLCFSLAGRKNSIAREWKLSTKAELLAKDVKLSAILQESPTLRKCCLKSAYAGHLKLSSTNQSSGREIPSPNHLRHWCCKWRNSRMICKSFQRNCNKFSSSCLKFLLHFVSFL